MALKMRVKITGQDEIVRRLNLLGEEARKVVEPAALAAAEVIRRAASENAAKGKYATGDLAGAIVAETQEVKNLKATVAVGPDKEHFYGTFVELGHAMVPRGKSREARRARKAGTLASTFKFVEPHPFLRPALDENRDKAQAVFTAEVRRRLGL